MQKLSDRPEWYEAALTVSHAFIQSAQIALVHAPNGKLLRTAIEEGEHLIALGKAHGDEKVVAEGFRSLGVLHLDPYAADHITANYHVAHQVWLQRGSEAYGPLGSGISEVAIPEPRDALRTAEEYLRQAIPLMEGHHRGLALKALAQAMFFSEAAGSSVNRDEIGRVVDEALELVDREKAPDIFATLIHYRHVPRGGTPSASSTSITADQITGTLDPYAALTTIQATAATMPPEEALEFLGGAQDFVSAQAEESLRMNQYALALAVIGEAAGVKYPKKLGWLTKYEKLEKKFSALEGESAARALVGLAARASSWNEEPRALATLDEAIKLSPSLANRFRHAYAYLRAALYLGMGSNGVSANDPVAAIAGYGRAVDAFLRLELRAQALDCVRRIHDVVQNARGNPDAPVEVVTAIAVVIQVLSSIDEGAPVVRDLLRDSLAAMAGRSANPVALMFLIEMAKGVRLGAALRGGYDRDAIARLHRDPQFEEITARNATARHVITDPLSAEYEILLTAYVGSGEQQSGDEPGARLANLQRAFENRINAAAGPVGAVQLFATAEELQQRLNERSVLIIYYLGRTQKGTIGIYMAAFTREAMRFDEVDIGLPDSVLGIGIEDRNAESHPLALHVNAVRAAVLDDDDVPWIVSDEGARLLEHDREQLFGHIAAFLDQQRKAGKDCLYIVPHGPLHFYPFHLVGKADAPLADNWTVAYVPNLQMLLRDRDESAEAASDVLTVGLGFADGNPFNLPPLPAAPEEARAIAGMFDADPLLDATATRAAVMTRLRNSRYVHLSTHGAHDVNAAVFQSLFLAPDDETDGRLFAHDILALDLRHVEVVTLSACETALGRFDISDNLRGLPASFLLAGVSMLVGTLWPVRSDVAKAFFVAFYERLKGGFAVIDSFRAAQLHVRNDYDNYRDWGAFYLIAAPKAAE
jgi:CHAT domain-containing protein/tetratricopeptide (TPR) repeat protein